MPLFLTREIWNNTLLNYLIFLLILGFAFLAAAIVGRLLTKLPTNRRKSERSYFWLQGIQKYVKPLIIFLILYFDIKILNLPPAVLKVIDIGVLAFLMIVAAFALSAVAAYFIAVYWKYRDDGDDNLLALKLLTNLSKALIWIVILILFLDNVGVKIDSLIAGLGISGLAVAFAAQTILKDLFCFFSILFDKPFVIGDFIVVGEQMGTVEHIGVKTTRLRSLNGEELILSNSDLTNSRISNFKTLEKRRVLFNIGVTYDTPVEKMRMIPGLIRAIIEGVESTEFGRVHFNSYGTSSLNFEIAYFILSGDFAHYMDIHQEVNLQIKERFDEAGIHFAFPTQSIQILNEGRHDARSS
ncbi:mechanosensitive ion channel family protein [Oscillospiraceae bacterium CM]|nr:mechanosensitive ion channel family protein [Oscillospiraceae bacterium CM]